MKTTPRFVAWLLSAIVLLHLLSPVRAGTLSVTNGSFTNLTGLSVNIAGQWYGGVPAGWSTASGSSGSFTVLNSGGTYYANLDTLGPSSPSFTPLRQNVGTVDITSDVTITFTLTTLGGTSSLGAALYDLALAAYTSALASTNISSITGVSTVSFSAKGVGPGTALYMAFWDGGGSPGITGVSIADTATTYLWNGGVSGVWTNAGGGWTDKFDNTATNYNNAKPVVVQFTNAAAGTNVTVAANGVVVGNVEVGGSDDYAFSGGTITMTNTTWSVATGRAATVSNVLAGTTALTKSGAGQLLLASSNSYSGGTTLSAGTLTLGNANALGSGAITVNGGTLDLGGNNLTAVNLGGTGGTISLGANTLTASMSTGGQFNGTISGSGGLVKTGASFLTLAGSNSYTGGTTVNAGTLFVIGSGTLGDAAGTVAISNAVLDLRNQQTRTGTITMIGQDARLLSGDVNNPGSVVNNGGALQFGGGQISASISGTGGLNVTGGGSLNSSNSFTGATTISATPGWYGANTLFVVNAHALGAASGDLTISGGTVNLQNNTVARSGNVTISGGTINAGTLSKSDGNFSIQGGTINAFLAGTAGLVKNGAGTATLGASNSYAGATDLQAGTLSLSNNGRLAAGAVTISNGASLNFATGAGQTNIVANGISGAGQLLNNNSSETRFTGSVTSTGGLTINSGTVRIGNGGTTGSYIGNTVLNGGTLAFDRSDNFTYGGIISGSGSLSKVSAGTVVLAGNSTNFSGTLTIFSGIARLGDGATNGLFSGNTTVNGGGQLVFDRSDASSYSGTISGAGAVVKVNTGAMTLSASNSYSGTTTLFAGSLVADNADALGTGNITFSSGGGNTGTIRYTAASAGTDWGARFKNSTGTIRLDTDGHNVALAGAIDSSNTQGLVKSGSGSLTLSGANAYTGTTSVTAGVLELASTGGAAAGGTSALSVGTGATLLLSQSDQVNNGATVTLSGGTIQRASGVSEVFGNLNLTAASALDFGNGSSGFLRFGTYAQDTESALLTVQNFFQGNSLVFSQNLVSAGYLDASSSGNYNNGYFAFADGFTTSWNGTDTFTITAIPEPSTYLAAAGLLAMMLWSCRRPGRRPTLLSKASLAEKC
jgi:autotransporter-associated beta strand protein